ncbi:MAG TPA: carbamoyltransferase HypF [Spirochaetota bacterium]|nr:carbamoyltransferase HypF [Spirochaetota bacterium]
MNRMDGSDHIRLRITGIVQGVGFRPFVYRIALKYGITGLVRNDTRGVLVHAQGKKERLNSFVEEIRGTPPPLSRIDSMTIEKEPPGDFKVFHIEKSAEAEERTAIIPPDSAICDECLAELLDPADRRFGYPFITCTNCGPRFSIVRDIPYDRNNTSMEPFDMCPACGREYGDPLDRRFHTQPNACPDCGPRLELRDVRGTLISADAMEIACKAAAYVREGRIIAIKSIGGYLLACDAQSDTAVLELRRRKGRPSKPFALMAGTYEKAASFLEIDETEKRLLLSHERPIVLMKEKTALVSRHVAPGLSYIGLMFPYSPFQHMLFGVDPDTILIMTSGNVAEEPIVYRDREAFGELGRIADVFVTYNRDIEQFSDDSVLFAERGKPFFVRRSRGYVPVPLVLSTDGVEVFATGGDLKSSFAYARGPSAVMSQFIGDLESPSANELYRKQMGRFGDIYRFEPRAVACDMHPGYFTTAIAGELEEKGLRKIAVQHHHAHIASVMEERNLKSRVIGIAFDGTGYGADGRLWGAEFMVADRQSFERRAHFSYFSLPGGENAIRDVWKIGIALLHARYGEEYPLMRRDGATAMVCEMIEKDINCPQTCSIGRLFDGMAAVLGIAESVSAEAEAAMLLEEAALRGAGTWIDDGWMIPVSGEGPAVISTVSLVDRVVSLRLSGLSVEAAAYAFHVAIAGVAVAMAGRMRDAGGINDVVLSGGAFQNRLLLRLIIEGLQKKRFDISLPEKIPFNDGCLALGQIAVAREIFHNE